MQIKNTIANVMKKSQGMLIKTSVKVLSFENFALVVGDGEGGRRGGGGVSINIMVQCLVEARQQNEMAGKDFQEVPRVVLCEAVSSKMGAVRITSLNPKFNGSHFGLPPSSIHRMTGWVANPRIL